MFTPIVTRVGAIRTVGSVFIIDSDDIIIDDGRGGDVRRIVTVMVMVMNIGSRQTPRVFSTRASVHYGPCSTTLEWDCCEAAKNIGDMGSRICRGR